MDEAAVSDVASASGLFSLLSVLVSL